MSLPEIPRVEPGQEFVIDRFRPGDAQGVVNLFRAVYGDEYPMRQYYDPEWLIAANARNEVVSVVARTPGGDIVSHMAGHRSSPLNAGLYEIGIGLTLADYRGAHASGRIMRRIVDILPGLQVAGFFGEAVCNHTVTQKFCQEIGAVETGFEIDLMPAETYGAEKSSVGRVSCLFAFMPFREAPQTLHVPACHLDNVRFMLDPVPGERSILPASARPAQEKSVIETKIFDFAAVSRCQLSACGEDFAAALADMERQTDEKQCTTRQVFLNLNDPASGAAAGWLREHGYSLGAVTPRWFPGDADGLLLQKLMHPPGFAQIRLYSERARELLRRVEADWREVHG